MASDCEKLSACLVCGGTDLIKYLDLGKQPLANSYQQKYEPLKGYPLGVNLCPSCLHSQLTHVVDPKLMFDDYLYVSGTSKTLGAYFDRFVDHVVRDDFGEMINLRVLDIGCNDGSLLERFRAKGNVVFGVDPAANLAKVRAEKDIPGFVGYWNDEAVDGLLQNFEASEFDIIVAMNVIAHNADPLGFLQRCRDVLAPDGRIYVQTSQSDMLANAEFDTVYHEHVSYFTQWSMSALAQRAGLKVVNLQIHPIHGNSIIYTMKCFEAAEPWYQNREFVGHREPVLTFGDFQERVEAKCEAFVRVLERARNDNMPIVGYGAAAKGMTMLNHLSPRKLLRFIVDDNPLKQGKYAAAYGIPVVAPDHLLVWKRPLCFVLLAWNFADEIIGRIKELRPDQEDVFVQMFPHIKVTR